MPETWGAWAAVAGIAYFWMGLARVAEDFNLSYISRPAYARTGGPHLLFIMLYQPIASLLFFTIGGPGRVQKMLVGAVVHFGLVLLGFWLLHFFIASEWMRLAIIGGIIFLNAVLYLLPIRNTR